MANANQALAGYGRRIPRPLRLTGALAAGTAFAASQTKKERVYVGGFQSVRVRVKLSGAPTGTLTVTTYPMLSDAGTDDTVGTRGAAHAAGTALTTANESVIDIALKGEEYIEIEGVMSSTGGNTATVQYVEICGIPLP